MSLRLTLKKFGNSRALVIPKAILDLFGVGERSEFSLEAKSDGFVVRYASEKSQKLESARRNAIRRHGDVYASLANK